MSERTTTIKGEDFFQSLSNLMIVPFGSLWWVAEDIWKNERRRFENSIRMSHPGLAISKDRLSLTLDPYSMLHGTRKRGGRCFEVAGISFKDGVPEITYFGKTPPIRLKGMQFQSGRISRCQKESVTSEEKSRLEAFLRSKGWC